MHNQRIFEEMNQYVAEDGEVVEMDVGNGEWGRNHKGIL